ncbi:MAG: phosphatidylserine decarboxylase [Myxococcales bacterium]|nr:phosphatidylserine decarboxylase [Myxococcales bacterium]
MASAEVSETLDPHTPPLAIASIPTSVQPGGGFCVDLEARWGRLRRAWLRTVRRGYVREMAAKRQGQCASCTHDIIDARDLKLVRNVCGHWFRPEDDRFRWRDRIGLARYGLAEVVISHIAAALFVAAATLGVRATGHPAWWGLLVPAIALSGFALWFFRDPDRIPPVDPRALLSPADGVITHLDNVDAPGFPGGRATRISIYLSPWNVHLQRMPRRARVTSVRYFPGAFLHARHRDCVQRNEQMWVDFEEPGGRMIRVKQVSGKVARRLVCWLKLGEETAVGERFGLIKFGSRADVLIPIDAAHEMTVAIGSVVEAGTTVLLRFEDAIR